MDDIKRATLGFMLSLGAAVVAGFLTTVVLVKATHTKTIVVTTRNLSPYTRIRPTDLKAIRVPIDLGMQGTESSLKKVEGMYLSFAVPSGYPVTSGDLNATNSYSSFLTNFEEETGQPGVEMELPVTTPIESVVQPGDSIALIVTNNTGGAASYETIQPVKVLNVLQPAKGGTATDLLIYVTEQNYQVLSQALLNNQVQIGLIPQNNSFVTPATSGINLSSIPSVPPNESPTNTEIQTMGGGRH